MPTPDPIMSMVAQFSALVAAVWAVTEYLPRALPYLRNVPKQRIALWLGPVSGVLGHVLGWVSGGEGWKGYLNAFLIGGLATILAGTAHDKLVGSKNGGNGAATKETP